MKTKLETIAVAVLLIFMAAVCADGADIATPPLLTEGLGQQLLEYGPGQPILNPPIADDEWENRSIIERMKRKTQPPSEEAIIQRATKTLTESTLVRAMRSASLTGPPMPPSSLAAEPLPPNVRLVSWDIDPSPSLSRNGVYYILYGPSRDALTNRILTTAGTDSAKIIREPGVRNYWSVVAVSDDGVESEKVFNEHRLPLAYEKRYVALESETLSGLRVPIVTNVITATKPIGFLWGEMTSTIIP